MNTKKLVIASVLKPVNDSRNYEKTAISISKLGIYQVHLVGQKVRELPMGSSIRFNPIFDFSRLNYKRLFASWTFFFYLCRLKPDVVFITTFELLWPASIYKILFRKKMIYDVQENYVRNLLYTSSFPFGIKHLLSIYVRVLEYLTRPVVDWYILAEKLYETEFSFTKNKSTVIENKTRLHKPIARVNRKDDSIVLLYTGTLAENYGIYEAIGLAVKLHSINPSIKLRILGFAAQQRVYNSICEMIQGLDYIEMMGGQNMVPHPEILQAICEADFGLVAYRTNKSTENCIPTKLYEYMALKLPIICSKNRNWENAMQPYSAGFIIDYSNPDVPTCLERISNGKFYTSIPGKEMYWEEETIQHIINKIT